MKSRPFRQVIFACAALLAAAAPAAAQTPLTLASLKGSYFVRYLGVIGYPNDFPASFAGTLTFDGIGGYTTTGSGVYYNGSTQTLPVSSTGTYNVLPNGEVAIANPFSQGNATLYGGIGANGSFVASSTESGYLDLIVGIAPSTSASTGTLSGTYHVAGLEFAGGSISSMRNLHFDATADGKGGLGNLSLSGSSSALNDATASQSITGATYTLVAAGSGTITFPAPTGVSTANQLISGAKNLYVSPDGSFFVSGAPGSWDMQIGVKALASGGSTAFNGLYYYAFTENVTGANGGVDSAYGASNELASITTELVHERVNSDGFAGQAYDFTFTDSFTPGNDGTSSSAGFYFAVGANGNYAIEMGGQGDYYLEVWTKLPSFSGSGVFLNPTGIVNAASNAPFTSQISPGEVISLYGTGFTSLSQPQTASVPFPSQLGGVQVMINGTAAPVYYVSPTQISAVVPYTTPSDGRLVNIQVVSSGAQSNTVPVYTGLTSPGIFTVPAGGLGSGAILHADFSLVSASSPAKVGETVQLFLTGLGAVSGGTVAGTAAPSTQPFATVSVPVDVFIDNYPNFSTYTQAKVAYQGLAPGLAGLYQVNFTIPSGITLNATGVTNFYVEISMLEQADADNIQATIPISH
jgi:uncharacterized protein (TIGR03437 family)